MSLVAQELRRRAAARLRGALGAAAQPACAAETITGAAAGAPPATAGAYRYLRCGAGHPVAWSDREGRPAWPPARAGWPAAARSFAAAAEPPPPPPAGWVGRLPPSLRPFAELSRLDKPIGSWLLFWPGAWAIALAAPPGALPDARLLALFAAGSILLRGAGCTVNDLWDRELDARVARTRSRPLPSGAVSPAAAVGWLAAQLGAGLGVLLALPPGAQALGAAALPLVALYPLAKRVTGWPQAVLGLTINWGALLGWAAARGGELEAAVVAPLYLAGACWTLVYDTVYAHQDRADDAAAGVRSAALTLGVGGSRPVLAGFATGAVALAGAAGAAAGCGAPFAAGLAAGAAQLAWTVGAVDFEDAADCGDKFRAAHWFGAALFAGAAADRALAAGALG
jgi:4-hydroxybenzoate polyprenyltransferase